MNARFIAITDANAKVTQRTLGARSIVGDRGRVAGEVEHHQHQRREDRRGQKRRPAAQLEPEVLARDDQREPKQP